MEVLFLVLSFIVLGVISKKTIRIVKSLYSSRHVSAQLIIKSETRKSQPYEERKKEDYITKCNHEKYIEKTPEDFLNDLLADEYEKCIAVDAELIFKYANFEDQYYLYATHYFPGMDEVYGKKRSGEIVKVDLYDQKEATHPTTGERIPGIKRYLRQHAVK